MASGLLKWNETSLNAAKNDFLTFLLLNESVAIQGITHFGLQ